MPGLVIAISKLTIKCSKLFQRSRTTFKSSCYHHVLVGNTWLYCLLPPLLVWQGALDLGYLFYSEDCPKEGNRSFPGIFRKMKITIKGLHAVWSW